MREILFRGKRINSIKAGEWAEGFFMEWLNPCKNRKEARIQTISEGGCIDLIHEVDPSTVGQYTGLKDKNDKRIFEGDIFDWGYAGAKDLRYVVVYDAGLAAFVGERSFGFVSLDGIDIEIIGNIHDNPELMEER